ncbi:hypothetical protein AAHE18_07G103600 [Arachis hypogaea]
MRKKMTVTLSTIFQGMPNEMALNLLMLLIRKQYSTQSMHLAGDSLIPEAISKKCIEDAKVLHQVDKKFIPVVASATLAVIDQHAADERIRLEELRQKKQKE